jgi:hypothetical protein
MTDWKGLALQSLNDARDEIEKAQVPTIVVVLTIAEADLLKEMPLSVYANQNWKWLQRVMAFAAWRFSLRDETDEPARAATPTPEKTHGEDR